MHVGKDIPKSNKCYIDIRGDNWSIKNSGWPRVLKLIHHPFPPVGSVALKWKDIDVVSSIADYISGDSTGITYTFQHPTESDLKIVFEGHAADNPAPTSTGAITLTSTYTCYDETGVVARYDHVGSPGALWLFPVRPPIILLSPSPAYKPFPLKWDQLQFYSGPGIWEDNPGYEPYVTRE